MSFPENPLVIIIMAGGEGTRMNSNIPKVLHTFNNIPMIVRIVNETIVLNPQKIIIITGKYTNDIKNCLLNYLSNNIFNRLLFVNQPQPLGTGDAIKCSLNYFNNNDNVLILNGDMPLIKSATLFNFIVGNSIAKLLVAELDNPFNYGRILIDSNNKFIGIKEEKECNNDEKKIKLINVGIYYFRGSILKTFIPLIKNLNSKHEYYLTDIVSIIKNNSNIDISTFIIDNNNKYQIMGVNTKLELENLEKLYK